MLKIAKIVLLMAGLSLLPFSAQAGYWVKECYRPCKHCSKVCKYFWVGHHKHKHHHKHHHHNHHRHHH